MFIFKIKKYIKCQKPKKKKSGNAPQNISMIHVKKKKLVTCTVMNAIIRRILVDQEVQVASLRISFWVESQL